MTREGLCQSCGREYRVWFAPNDVWNPVMRREDGSDRVPFICPTCFIDAAEETGLVPTAWVVAPEQSDWPPLGLVRSLLAAIDGHATAIGDEMEEATADLRLGRLIRQAAGEKRMVIHASWHDRNGIVRGDYLTHPLDVALNNVAVQAQELLDLAAEYEKEGE